MIPITKKRFKQKNRRRQLHADDCAIYVLQSDLSDLKYISHKYLYKSLDTSTISCLYAVCTQTYGPSDMYCRCLEFYVIHVQAYSSTIVNSHSMRN